MEKKKPTYVLAEDILPLTRVFALYQVLQVEPLPTSKTSLHMVKLADRTGTINMVLKDADLL